MKENKDLWELIEIVGGLGNEEIIEDGSDNLTAFIFPDTDEMITKLRRQNDKLEAENNSLSEINEELESENRQISINNQLLSQDNEKLIATTISMGAQIAHLNNQIFSLTQNIYFKINDDEKFLYMFIGNILPDLSSDNDLIFELDEEDDDNIYQFAIDTNDQDNTLIFSFSKTDEYEIKISTQLPYDETSIFDNIDEFKKYIKISIPDEGFSKISDNQFEITIEFSDQEDHTSKIQEITDDFLLKFPRFIGNLKLFGEINY